MLNLPFTLRQLEVFAALAACDSFRATSEELGISQASVSNQVKALEEQLGVRLFDRKPGRKPLLTTEGRAFLHDLHAFERHGQVLASHRRRDPEENVPVSFRLLVGQGMFDGYVRRKLDQFYEEHPLIELEFEALPPTTAASGSAQDGRFDFALINLRADMPFGDDLKRLAKVQGGIYGHRKYAEGRRLPLTADEVNLLPFVLPQAGTLQERELLRTLDTYGIRPRKVVCHTQYYDVMAAMLDRGIAVASFTEAILPPAAREHVVQLMEVEDWNLLLFRKPAPPDPRRDAVEKFLVSSVLDDPTYPALETYA